MSGDTNALVNKDRRNDHPNQTPRRVITGVFAPAILQRHLDQGIPVSLIPLRAPGLTPHDFTDIPEITRTCKCRKTKCLVLYCECFASTVHCNSKCHCQSSCQNNDTLELNREQRNKAILELIQKDPSCFRTAARVNNKRKATSDETTTTTCACATNQCISKYCACRRNGETCGSLCRCRGCLNNGGNNTTTTLMNGKNNRHFEMPGISYQTSTNKEVSPDRGKGPLQTLKSNGGSRSSDDILAERILDEMQRVLSEDEIRGVDSSIGTDSLARTVISRIQSYVKQMIQTGEDAADELRKAALPASQQQAGVAPAPPPAACSIRSTNNGNQIIGVGTRFTKDFDILGTFEGVVVGTPNEISPFYQVEYEDGGSEALLHQTLWEIVRKSELLPARPSAGVAHDGGPGSGLSQEEWKKLEAQMLVAREEAYQQACVNIIRQNRQTGENGR